MISTITGNSIMKAIEVTDPGFLDTHWRAYNRLLEMLHKKYNSFHNRQSWEKKKRQILSIYEMDITQHRFIIFDNEKVTGWMDFYMQNVGMDSEFAFVGFDGLYDNYPDTFSRLLVATLIQLLDKYNCTNVYIMSSCQRGSRIVKDWGANEVCLFNRYELPRKKVNENLLYKWIHDGEKANPDLALKFFAEFPDEILIPYISLMSQCLNDMPRENDSITQFLPTLDEFRQQIKWRQENNKVKYSMTLFYNDTIIGVSEMSINRDDPLNIFQMMTGVERKYRGQKLSKWLKASIILKIGEDFPENKIITTDMRAVNTPIQAVNSQLGYNLVSEGNEFEMTCQMLKDWISASK